MFIILPRQIHSNTASLSDLVHFTANPSALSERVSLCLVP